MALKEIPEENLDTVVLKPGTRIFEHLGETVKCEITTEHDNRIIIRMPDGTSPFVMRDHIIDITYGQRLRPGDVTQVGASDLCARKGCKSWPAYRLILGSFNIQAYVCTKDLVWGLNLDRITERNGELMGWEYGRMRNGVRYCGGGVQVIKNLPKVRRPWDYTRDVLSQISEQFPQKNEKGWNVWHAKDVAGESA